LATVEGLAAAPVVDEERPMEEWTAAWEALFNLGSGEITCHDERREVVNFCYHFTDLGRCFGSWWRWDELADRFRAMIPELRHKYYLNKSPRTTNELTVAIPNVPRRPGSPLPIPARTIAARSRMVEPEARRLCRAPALGARLSNKRDQGCRWPQTHEWGIPERIED